jgi:hypothetical protein
LTDAKRSSTKKDDGSDVKRVNSNNEVKASSASKVAKTDEGEIKSLMSCIEELKKQIQSKDDSLYI